MAASSTHRHSIASRGDNPAQGSNLRRRAHWSSTTVAATAALCLVASACGSSSSTTSATSSPSPAGASTKGLSAAPFVGTFVTDPEVGPDYAAGIKAATKAINAKGGIDGHPISITSCSDNNDPNAATTCVRNGVSDSASLAFVGVSSSYGSSYDPLIQQAGMSSLGPLQSSAADDTTANVFAFFGGTFNTIGSAPAAVALLGAKRIGVPYIGVPAGAQLPPFVKALISPLGGTEVGVEAIPVTATDYSSFAAQEIAAKPDAVISGLTSGMLTPFIKAVESQGGNLQYLLATGSFSAAGVQKAFGNSIRAVLIDSFDHQAPGYQHFLSDMKSYNPSYDNLTDSVLSGWLDVYAFAEALKGVIADGTKTPTRASIVRYMQAQTDFDVQGLTGGINFTKPNAAEGGALSRVIANSLWLEKYSNGKETPLNGGKPFTLFPATS